MPLPNRLVVAVGLALILLLVGGSVGFAQEVPSSVMQVRAIEPEELGITNPAGLAFSQVANVFYVVEASEAGQSPTQLSDITVLSARPMVGLVDTVGIPATIPDPINVAFDGKARRLLLFQPATLELIDIAAGPDGELDSTKLTRHNVPRFGLRSPQGMTVDPASGRLYLLDSIGPRIVRVDPDPDGGFDSAVITQLDLADTNLAGLRGLALNPANGHLYTTSPARQMLYELTQTGRVVASHDLSSFGLDDPQGLVFAPTGDLTDDASLMSLYVADTGLADGLDRQTTSPAGGQIVELAFNKMEPMAITADATATLVQIIDTSAFYPPSPDSAGIVYIEPFGTLLMSDSEVDEMPMYFTGDNVFEISLDGRLLSTATTLPFSIEASGLAYNPANQHLFITDDNRRRVWEIAPGDDGLYFTADDPPKTSFNTTLFGCTDAEGIAFDTWNGVIFLADGLNKEVFRVAPGPDGLFNGVAPAGDDVVTQWDTSVLGMTDPGGITFDAENGYLYLVGIPKTLMAHVTTTGSLVRMIDISAANGILPAGLTVAPSTLDSRVMSIYLTDRGVDNGADPFENDGKVYEMYVPALSADVALVKSVEPAFASAGDTITYTLSFHNAGSETALGVVITDIIPAELAVQSVISSGVFIVNTGAALPYVWQVEDLDTTESGIITITAEVSSTLACFDTFTNTATITTTSADTRPGNDSSSVTVASGSGVIVDLLTSTETGNPGTPVVHSLWITNTGTCTDTFDVAASGTAWAIVVQSEVGPLDPGQGAQVDVTVNVPAEAPCGAERTIITFASQGSSGAVSASSELVTTVNTVYGVAVDPPGDTLSGDPGVELLYTLEMTNIGNCLDGFDLTASQPSWITDFPSTVEQLLPGLGFGLNISAIVPPDALSTDQDIATMTLTSQGNSAISATSIITTSVNVVYGVEVDPPTAFDAGDPGTGVSYTLQLTNTGNCSDTFIRSISGNSWFVNAPTLVGPLNPGAGESVDVTVSVPACTTGGVNDSVTVTFASQAPGTGSDSLALTTTANSLAPVASDDTYNTTEDVPLVGTALGTPPGVLDNDNDANCDLQTVSQYTQPTDGTVVVDADGSFTYTPTLNFHGSDSFTYRASDGVLTDTATVSITVTSAGDDPIVEAGPDQPAAGDPPIEEGDTVSFTGSFVDPARRTPLAEESIQWDFGDGDTATGTLTPDHTYLDNDVYTVTLTVTDIESDVGQDSLLVTVLNVPPAVNAGPDQSADPGEVLSFSGIYTDTVADTHTIQWDLGDGTIINDNLTFDHAFEATGDYTVTLTVTDDDGGVGSDTAIISVRFKTYLPLVLRISGP